MWNRLAITILGIVACSSIDRSFAQDPASTPTDDHEYAQLGIEITDSPGVDVQVSMVAVGGPADSNGIHPGDYLLSINGKPIDKPDDLIAIVRGQQPGTKVTVGLWRDGEASEQKIVLATASDAVHRADRAWLGVTLEANGSGGAKIRQVIPGSPAARVKLAAGDVIVAINDAAVDSAKDLGDAIESRKAGETITLILAGETQTKRDVKLGSIASAPPIFSLRVPMSEMDSVLPESFMSPESWKEPMTELRRQLEELRKAIRDQGTGVLQPDDDESEEQNPSKKLPDNSSSRVSMAPSFQLSIIAATATSFTTAQITDIRTTMVHSTDIRTAIIHERFPNPATIADMLTIDHLTDRACKPTSDHLDSSIATASAAKRKTEVSETFVTPNSQRWIS